MNPEEDGIRVTVRLNESMANEIDKYAAAKGMKRSAAIRDLVSRSLVGDAQAAHADLLGQAVRKELASFKDEMRAELITASEETLMQLEEIERDELDTIRELAGATLWMTVRDAYREDGGSMDGWHRLALSKARLMGTDHWIENVPGVPEGE